MNKRITWTEEKLRYLREHFAAEPACDIADALGCSTYTVSKKARELGLTKSPDFRRTSYIGRYVKKQTTNR